ncbi:MAG: hypothetical protein AABX66_02425 [Nanoarchaeota archaeon]
MNLPERILKLTEVEKELLPKVKSWNRDRLLLAWGFSAALLMTIGLSIIQYVFTKNQSNSYTDGYIISIIFLFVFGIILTLWAGHIIDQNANDANITLEIVHKELQELKKIKH